MGGIDIYTYGQIELPKALFQFQGMSFGVRAAASTENIITPLSTCDWDLVGHYLVWVGGGLKLYEPSMVMIQLQHRQS